MNFLSRIKRSIMRRLYKRFFWPAVKWEVEANCEAIVELMRPEERESSEGREFIKHVRKVEKSLKYALDVGPFKPLTKWEEAHSADRI